MPADNRLGLGGDELLAHEADRTRAEGKRRLSEQVVDAASKSTEIAKDAAETIQYRFRDLANSARQKAVDLAAGDDGAALSQQSFAVDPAPSAQDTVLLGIASAAVAAAVAMSF